MRRLGKVVAWAAVIVVALAVWTKVTEHGARAMPDYERVDISGIVEKELPDLTTEDYELLFWQAGLGKPGVQTLYQSGRQAELLYLQERFFAEVEVVCESSWGLYCESIAEDENEVKRAQGSHMPALEDGDILITSSSHFLGWRNGHAALVVDGEEGLTLEAIAIGCDSQIMSISRWRERPCFVVLRLPGVSAEQRKEIARYAEENLVGIPYDLVAMAKTGDAEQKPAGGTQCAHLVWQAYAKFGYDLNSGGNSIVTPDDLLRSPMLEKVQIYGVLPENVNSFLSIGSCASM